MFSRHEVCFLDSDKKSLLLRLKSENIFHPYQEESGGLQSFCVFSQDRNLQKLAEGLPATVRARCSR